MSVKRIAMWSGPRNLSTALMRSFASRIDCTVIDEPFYAAYLKASEIEHPMKDLILKTYNVDPKEVAQNCVESEVNTKIQYQKHMTHHMLDPFDRSFVYSVSNAFLVRSPEKVIKSFGKKIADFALKDLGYIQQVDLFDMVCNKVGSPPPVIDADDLCANPAVILPKLCTKLGISYSDKMLAWSTGSHSYDGVWGRYWYRSVNKSSGFIPPEDNFDKLSSFQRNLINEANLYFDRLNEYKISF
ncbi:MAG: HAD family hydrolase [Paracoccaceae bacterium]|nr:HAD family hydrolase [Paracoccaceae bacterium]